MTATFTPGTPTDGSPFSTSDEGEGWMSRWCEHCTRDGDVDSGLGCPLIVTALFGQTPAEWVRHPEHTYVCLVWSDRPDDCPSPGPVADQLALVDELPRAQAPRPGIVARAAAAGHLSPVRRRMRTVELPDRRRP